MADVPRDDAVVYGVYLAGPLGHCIECHTPLTGTERDFAGMTGAGGVPLSGPWGTTVSANITLDVETGLGEWTDDEFKAAITRAVRRDGIKLAPPIPFTYYATIRADDLDALIAYLRSLKPVSHRVR